ncbi:hypothetical protein J0X19_11460 [Hymenobacter sp. BT186]|uniref:Lipoprotein n=1 Tax=Hymenobacter telluris TaxID=2816474 RepID=A0A939EWN1_9BACT|nr:hypothetical protein [Hymenobacter telluris]MBO0358564.1 hypothetical protein [Hymenobacter telluris]MBW3374590.1 hypothetical protein [Hymenobacter norwichensis]
MRFFTMPLLAVALLWSVSSCNTTTDQPTTSPAAPTEPTGRTAAAASPSALHQANQEAPVSLAGETFRLKSFPLDNTAGEAPQVTIYLYPSQQPDSVLVGVDTEPSVLDPDQGTRLGVPKSAVLLFQTYYAGAGHHYYAVAEGNQLRVYRRKLEEATPENEHAARPPWQLFKTFGFFTSGARQLQP